MMEHRAGKFAKRDSRDGSQRGQECHGQRAARHARMRWGRTPAPVNHGRPHPGLGDQRDNGIHTDCPRVVLNGQPA